MELLKKRVGIIGAGVIGIGVAQSFAMHGSEVILIDLTDQKLALAKEKIEKNVRFFHMLSSEKIEVDNGAILKNIEFTTDLQTIQTADVIVENIDENFEKKRDLYSQLKNVIQKSTMVMVNTSCISIRKIAEILDSPNVLGVHFMNPVQLKKAVEVIVSPLTSNDALEKVLSLLTDIQKKGIVVNDHPGFVSNRISHVFMNEAAYTLQDGVADAKTIDEIFKKCFGHKMGPLETADLIGIDTVRNSLIVLYESYDHNDKYKPCSIFDEMITKGELGRKSKKGFYIY